jgi:hypothetical protein
MKPKVIALYSGGLDSTLAVLLTLKQGFDVIAVNFTTPFGCSPVDKSSCSRPDDSVALRFGFTLKYFPLGDKFIDMVKRPKYGRGRNMNPCIDCRILMLKEARGLMEMTGAEFIITGEVVGQRPMSQYERMLYTIDEAAGVSGKVVRPLCGRLLRKTGPEERGLIGRENLLDVSGRRRLVQMDLARRLGLLKIPQPAGGCLLTDPVYSRRLRDLLKHNPDAGMWDISFLKVGRHFRLADDCKLIVGRRESENTEIERMAQMLCAGVTLITPADDTVPGPSSVLCSSKKIMGTVTAESAAELMTALSICARYSDGRSAGRVGFNVTGCGRQAVMEAVPADETVLERYRIGVRS